MADVRAHAEAAVDMLDDIRSFERCSRPHEIGRTGRELEPARERRFELAGYARLQHGLWLATFCSDESLLVTPGLGVDIDEVAMVSKPIDERPKA